LLRSVFRRSRLRSRIIAALLALIVGLLIWRHLPDHEFSLSYVDRGTVRIALSAPVGGEIAQAEGMAAVAENDDFQLLADLRKQWFRIVDKRGGIFWDSSPLDAVDDPELNENARKMAASPIHLSYTRNFKEIVNTQLLRERYVCQAFPIAGGIQLRYRLEDLQLSFAVELLLAPGGLEVRIPDESIVEAGSAGLVSLSVFPLLGAARQGDDGYIVVPDGSGAIVEFAKPHAVNGNKGYAKWVYGEDPTFRDQRRPESGEPVTMPVFGLAKREGGYVNMLTSGAEDARLIVNPPGVNNLPYYRGGLEFVLRKMYTSRLGSVDRLVPWVEKNRINNDRVARYTFVAAAEPSYADLAGIARAYYRDLWGESESVPDNPLLVRLFMGTTGYQGSLFQTPEVMTTFSEAERIADELLASGLERFSVALTGWYRGGYYGQLPQRWPADAHFGGDKGLLALLEHLNRDHIVLSMEDNDLDVINRGIGGNGVSLRSDAVRQPNGELYVHHPLRPSGSSDTSVRWYWLSPFQDEYRLGGLDYLKRSGVRSVDLRHVGELLFSDYNERMPIRRADTKAIFNQWMKEAKDALGTVRVYQGNDYALIYADTILDSVMSTSNDELFDRQIPFVQMVYHGSKLYYTPPINRSDVPKRELLRAVEYGAVPTFELTYRPTDRLKYTNYDRLYSSQYEAWMPELEEAYRMWQEVWQPLKDRRIVDHREAAADLFVTEYDDGTKIWVNYGERAYRSGGMTVEAMSYGVERNGGGSE